jgi:hypothetical protein
MRQKQIVYYYEAKVNEEDTQIDGDGDLSVPVKGQVLEKHGKRWNVEQVKTDYRGDGSLPVHHVYLIPA